MMIDWLTLVVPVVHKSVNGGRVTSYHPDGSEEWSVEKRVTVEGSYSSKIQVRSLDTIGEVSPYLWIHGNPSKYFQGHNLFGSLDLPALARAFVLAIIDQLGIEVAHGALELIDAGTIKITRVDLTTCFELPSREDVRSFIRAASVVAYGKHQKTSAYDSQTLYIGQNSKRASLKMYCKGDELEAHPLPKDMPQESREELLKYVDKLLRVEATFRGKWLKDQGLEMVSAWSYNKAVELLRKRIQAVNLPENLPITSSTEHDLADLPARLVAVYKLWLQGEDLREVYPKRTYYRYRSELLKHGIDLNCPPRKAEKSNVVPMWRYLVAEPVGVPDWAHGTLLYFDPSKPNLKVL